MKCFYLIGLSLLILSCSSSQPSSQLTSLPTTGGEKKQFSLRKYEEKKLDNGLRIIYISDPSLPRIGLQVGIQVGSALENKLEYGVAAMTASLLETGTVRRTALQVTNDFAQMGSGFGQSVSEDFVVLSTSGLSLYGSKLVDLFSEVVTEPHFSSEELQRKKSLFVNRITKEKDEPTQYAALLLNKELYQNHPYAHSFYGTEETIKNLKIENLKHFYAQFFRPEISILTVTGDLSVKLKTQIENRFSKWKSTSEIGNRNVMTAKKEKGLHFKLYTRKGLEQSQIRIGSLALPRNHPDFLALRLANLILGGEFASRLNQHVRDDLGLTYSISSEIDSRKFAGTFEISTFTRNEKVTETLLTTYQDVQKFIAEGINEKELRAAKSFLLGQFPLALETVDRLGYQLILLRAYGISDDYLSKFSENINAITVEQVNRVIRTQLSADNLKFVVYADQDKIHSQFQEIKEKIPFVSFEVVP